MPYLMLLRHAKSDWNQPVGSDWQRPLNNRGVRSARAVGAFVARHRLVPDLVLVSPAIRTATTAELAVEAGGWNTRISKEPLLYGAAPSDVINLAREVPNQVNRLMVVGHEPTMSGTLELICGTRLRVLTATLISINLRNTAWENLRRGVGEPELYIRPRLLPPYKDPD